MTTNVAQFNKGSNNKTNNQMIYNQGGGRVDSIRGRGNYTRRGRNRPHCQVCGWPHGMELLS